MKSEVRSQKLKIKSILFWTPRILTILFICFLGLFSLDVFAESSPWWQILGGFFIHNLPAIVLAIVLWISWKRDLVGAILFALAGVALLLFTNFSAPLIITAPAFIISILFLSNHLIGRKV